DDEPVDGGPGCDHTAPGAEEGTAPEADVAYACSDRRKCRGRGHEQRVAGRQTGARGERPAAEGQAQEEAGPPVTAEGNLLEIEASGETVGEAKWLALRELEKLEPGLDRNAVAFEVLTEGERGLLGVGRSPAR